VEICGDPSHSGAHQIHTYDGGERAYNHQEVSHGGTNLSKEIRRNHAREGPHSGAAR